MALIDDVKLFLRVDSTAEDSVINNMVSAAKKFIETGTGVTFDETDVTHVQALELLVSHWYEHREMVGTDEIPFTVRAILIQIEARRLLHESTGT